MSTSKCFGGFHSVKSKAAFASEIAKSAEIQKEMDRQVAEAYCATFVTPEQYIEAKLKMLEEEMYITPTSEELSHLKSLKTEVGIDNAVRSIIDRHWTRY